MALEPRCSPSSWPLPNGRIRWGADATSARIFAAWWQEGQPRFHTCTVILDSPTLLPMIDAFVEACKASTPTAD